MLLVLDSTSRTLRAKMADAPSSVQCSVTVTYADTTATTFTEGMYPIQLNGTSLVTILPAPASGVKRVVKSVMFFNDDTMTHTVTLYLTDNITDYPITKITLPAGASWASDDQTGVNVGGAVTDGSKGDIAVSNGGDTWTINNGVVTLAKMADIATDQLIGRDTAGTGVPEAISVSGGIEFSGSGSIRVGAFSGDVGKTAGSTILTLTDAAVTTAKLGDAAVTPAKLSATAQALSFRNRLMNGDFAVAQRGTSFTNATLYLNNNDGYVLDRWYIVSNGNNTTNVSQSAIAPAGQLYSCDMTVATANRKFGIAQIIEQRNCVGLIGGVASLSFKARISSGAGFGGNIKAAVIAWNGSADDVNSDLVSTWNSSGSQPTLKSSLTYEYPSGVSTVSNLSPSLTTSWQTYKIENIQIDTANATNIIVFIWCDTTSTTVSEVLYVTDVQLEPGATATNYERRPYTVELALCQRYFVSFGRNTGERFFGGAYTVSGVTTTTQWAFNTFPVPLRAVPTGISVSSIADWNGYTTYGNAVSTLTGLTGQPGAMGLNVGLLSIVSTNAMQTGVVTFLYPANSNALIGWNGAEL